MTIILNYDHSFEIKFFLPVTYLKIPLGFYFSLVPKVYYDTELLIVGDKKLNSKYASHSLSMTNRRQI